MDKGRTQKIAPLKSKAQTAKNENSIVEEADSLDNFSNPMNLSNCKESFCEEEEDFDSESKSKQNLVNKIATSAWNFLFTSNQAPVTQNFFRNQDLSVDVKCNPFWVPRFMILYKYMSSSNVIWKYVDLLQLALKSDRGQDPSDTQFAYWVMRLAISMMISVTYLIKEIDVSTFPNLNLIVKGDDRDFNEMSYMGPNQTMLDITIDLQRKHELSSHDYSGDAVHTDRKRKLKLLIKNERFLRRILDLNVGQYLAGEVRYNMSTSFLDIYEITKQEMLETVEEVTDLFKVKDTTLKGYDFLDEEN